MQKSLDVSWSFCQKKKYLNLQFHPLLTTLHGNYLNTSPLDPIAFEKRHNHNCLARNKLTEGAKQLVESRLLE